jgi:hypothetical protein
MHIPATRAYSLILLWISARSIPCILNVHALAFFFAARAFTLAATILR